MLILQNKKQFVEDLTKRYELGKRSTKAVAAGVLRNEDIYNKYFKGIYSPSSVRTVIDRFKKSYGFRILQIKSTRKRYK